MEVKGIYRLISKGKYILWEFGMYLWVESRREIYKNGGNLKKGKHGLVILVDLLALAVYLYFCSFSAFMFSSSCF